MTKSVAILGCGPAGLMVAHAARLSNWDFRIYSRKQKSVLYGAQYLHKPVPELNTDGPKLVIYNLTGTSEQYRRKVYGEKWDGTVSPEDFMEQHFAWDLRRAYDELWQQYEPLIIEYIIPTYSDLALSGKETAEWIAKYEKSLMQHDLVISTVPRKIWAQPGDVFESIRIWALGDTELPRVDKPYRPAPFTVQCDSQLHVPWYRVSNIFGHCTMEWPVKWGQLPEGMLRSNRPPHPGASLVEKPLRHNSKAASDFIHLGRYGAWEKGILTSDVFYQAMKVFARDKIDEVYGKFEPEDYHGRRW